MRRLDLLTDIDLGDDAAENDAVLDRAFVETDVFRRFLLGQVDLVTGLKGTGKSALYRMVVEHSSRFPELRDLRVVPAVNPTGSPVFKALFRTNASETRLRSLWMAYFTSLVANEVVDQYAAVPRVVSRVDEIRETLELLGLRQPAQRRLTLLQRLRATKSIEPTVGMDYAGNVTFGLRFDVSGAESPAVELELADFLSVLRSCRDVLSVVGERLWVLIDRLDECFTRDTAVERRALRALLRTQLDIASEFQSGRRLAFKVFLRSDLLRRMSADAVFTNLTHIRSADLRWNKSEIQAIVGRRVLSSPSFESLVPEHGSGSREARAWDRLVPTNLAGARKMGSVQALCSATCDGHRGFNPRNVLTLLRLAVEHAANLESGRTEPATYDSGEALIRQSDVDSAMGILSMKRFADTVLNEFPATKPLAKLLDRRDAIYGSEEDLLGTLGLLDATRARKVAAIDVLLLSGLVGQDGPRYVIPRLYRPALRAVGPSA